MQRMAKITLKQNKIGGPTLPDFQADKGIVIETECYWKRGRQIHQWETRTCTGRATHISGQLMWQRKQGDSVKKRQSFNRYC